MLNFEILGPLVVSNRDGPLPLGGARQRAVLAVLLLNANRVVSTDHLLEQVWGQQPPPTARAALQGHISRLRRVLEGGVQHSAGAATLVTHQGGYALRLDADCLDLHRFERLFEAGSRALADGATAEARELLEQALALWSGDALSDFAYEAFAQPAIARLEDLRLAALEERIEADLVLGRHADLVGDLEVLISENPTRERLRALIMVALYRSGRQADALRIYQEARRSFVEELGIEPSRLLQDLERQILRQDPALDAPVREAGVAHSERPVPAATHGAGEPPRPVAVAERSILVVAVADDALPDLVGIAAPLARCGRVSDLILTRMVAAPDGPPTEELERCMRTLHASSDRLAARGVVARVAAFTSRAPGNDVVRLAEDQGADLLFVDGSAEFDPLPGELGTILGGAPCDVAVLLAGYRQRPVGVSEPVIVPFGGAEHDWAALEFGAWVASAHGVSLRLVGTEASSEGGKGDASRLLATASLAVQRLVRIPVEPALTRPGAEGIVELIPRGGLGVVGLSTRWQDEGLGRERSEIAAAARAPVIAVHRGLRPGGIAPRATHTRYTWSLTPGVMGADEPRE